MPTHLGLAQGNEAAQKTVIVPARVVVVAMVAIPLHLVANARDQILVVQQNVKANVQSVFKQATGWPSPVVGTK